MNFNAKTQFLSHVNSKLLTDLNCNVTLPLEDMKRVASAYQEIIGGCLVQGNASEKLPVSLGSIPKQHRDGGILER